MNKVYDMAKMKRVIRSHYSLNRPVSDTEVRDEVASLRRKYAAGSLDTRDEDLYYRLNFSGWGKAA